MENFNFLPKEKQMAIFSEWKECQAIAKIKFGESYNHLYELYKGFIVDDSKKRNMAVFDNICMNLAISSDKNLMKGKNDKGQDVFLDKEISILMLASVGFDMSKNYKFKTLKSFSLFYKGASIGSLNPDLFNMINEVTDRCVLDLKKNKSKYLKYLDDLVKRMTTESEIELLSDEERGNFMLYVFGLSKLGVIKNDEMNGFLVAYELDIKDNF